LEAIHQEFALFVIWYNETTNYATFATSGDKKYSATQHMEPFWMPVITQLWDEPQLS